MTHWVLIIMLLSHAMDGGRAISAHLRFASQQSCETAAAKIRAVLPDWLEPARAVVCVEAGAAQ